MRFICYHSNKVLAIVATEFLFHCVYTMLIVIIMLQALKMVIVTASLFLTVRRVIFTSTHHVVWGRRSGCHCNCKSFEL